MNKVKHTKKDFDNIITENQDYEAFVEKYGLVNDVQTEDYEFIMKTITEAEFKIMVKLLQNKMVDYFRTNNNSLICRIYGVYI